MLTIIWHLLADTDAVLTDLGPSYYDTKTNPQRRVRNHVRELQAPGYNITLNPAA